MAFLLQLTTSLNNLLLENACLFSAHSSYAICRCPGTLSASWHSGQLTIVILVHFNSIELGQCKNQSIDGVIGLKLPQRWVGKCDLMYTLGIGLLCTSFSQRLATGIFAVNFKLLIYKNKSSFLYLGRSV